MIRDCGSAVCARCVMRDIFAMLCICGRWHRDPWCRDCNRDILVPVASDPHVPFPYVYGWKLEGFIKEWLMWFANRYGLGDYENYLQVARWVSCYIAMVSLLIGLIDSIVL